MNKYKTFLELYYLRRQRKDGYKHKWNPKQQQCGQKWEENWSIMMGRAICWVVVERERKEREFEIWNDEIFFLQMDYLYGLICILERNNKFWNMNLVWVICSSLVVAKSIEVSQIIN